MDRSSRLLARKLKHHMREAQLQTSSDERSDERSDDQFHLYGPLTFSIVCCTETAAKAVKEPWLCRRNATPATSALNKAKSTAPSAIVSSTDK